MAQTEHKYIKSSDSPLICVSHLTRHLNKKTGEPVDYSIMHAGISAQQHRKNTVVMSNLTYEHQDNGYTPLQPKVEKSRTKNLNICVDETGIYDRFINKQTPVHATYCMTLDGENEISDTYYLQNKPLIQHKTEKPFKKHVDSSSVGVSPPEKKIPLSQVLDNKNSRLNGT